MDIYEFSERDDQKNQNSSKQSNCKTRKSNEYEDESNKNAKRKRCRRSKRKSTELEENNPPIRLKLVRDECDPNSFKSVPVNQRNEIGCNYNSINKSVFSVKLNDGREFRINDIVWAKLDGFPCWPSKITSLKLPAHVDEKSDIPPDAAVACVEWFADEQISYIKCANLSNFLSEYDKKFSSKIKKKKYFKAVNEAKQLADEKLSESRICSSNSVHSCETFEADTSSTLPSHNFTSPESNQSIQSYHNPPRPVGQISDPLSNQSSVNNYSVDNNGLFPTGEIISSSSIAAQSSKLLLNSDSSLFIDNLRIASVIDLPDLGSNLEFEQHIPEFSDSEEDECMEQQKFAINKFLINVDNIK